VHAFHLERQGAEAYRTFGRLTIFGGNINKRRCAVAMKRMLTGRYGAVGRIADLSVAAGTKVIETGRGRIRDCRFVGCRAVRDEVRVI